LSTAGLLCVLMLGAAACSTGGSAVAATVGDTEITAAEVEETYARRAEAPPVASELAGDDAEGADPNLQASVLTTLIRTEILQQAAEERGIEVSDEQRSEQRAAIVEQAGGEEALQEVLAQSNVSDEELQANLTDQAIQSQISDDLASEVTDEEVETAFEQDPQGQYGEKVDVRHILTETEDAANDAIERIEDGEEFSAVAEEVSTDPGSAAQGGELGPLSKGMTVEAFDEAAFSAEVGELVGPVETDFGFHVIEVTEEVPAAELSEVEGEIRDMLAQSKFTQYITDFANNLEIEVDPAYGTWDAQQLAVTPPAPSEAPSAPQLPPGGSEVPLPDLSELPDTGSEAPAPSEAPSS
jgi:parvulin-like peptidyl-prolyl isomerase